MGRITIKGGVWKNTEDEILKAAVMKYGKNQWARISSLLVRKSAGQCKARWYEWLDPSIKKTEWSREEEEKLLHLAKIMPSQWRTIAPMLGRTAAQALEHYEMLLDAAQQPDIAAAAAAAAAGGPGSAAAAAAAKPSIRDRLEDPRRLRPGEIDPLPEAKPARPDPVDMEEDELEMLSEARARLANTKGKKAKRKAREKQLEEARRLAVLQKQRELRAAGIEPKQAHKRKLGIDYLEEIPFEKKPAAGFFDTTEEDVATAAAAQARGFKSVGLEQLEGKSRDQIELEERKKDAKRLKLFKETNLPAALLKINQLNDPQQISRRLDMNLPTPQINEQELAEIAKLGGQLGAAGAATPLRGPGATPMRGGAGALPARTPLRPDTILTESQNLLSLTQQNSSLLGGENTPLRGESDFSGVKPRSSAVQTPNVLASPLHAAGNATPGRAGGAGSVAATPMRDGLGINASSSLTAAQAINMSRARAADARKASKRLAADLSALPAPTNEFALVLPELPAQPADKADGSEAAMEDAEDVLSRAQADVRAQRAAAWRAETQVVQRGLPRPSVVNLAAFAGTSDPVEAAVEAEVLRLLQYDHAKYPQDPKQQQAAQQRKRSKLPALESFSEHEWASARGLVDAELAASNGGRALSESEEQTLLRALVGELSDDWDSVVQDQLFMPHLRQFGRVSEVSDEGQLSAAYQQQFALLRAAVGAQAKRAGKLEQQLSVLVGGYMQVNGKLRGDIVELHTSLLDELRKHSCFAALASVESSYALPQRKAELQHLYFQQQEKERQLQARYQQLNVMLQEAQEAMATA
jgi:pre-mRNA-splicing factor CDC5/CEF1